MQVPTFSVVIPAYNESSHLHVFLATIQEILETLQEEYEVIVVDDGSTDATWNILEKVSLSCPTLRALRLSRNFGKEAALCAGLEMARGTAVIVMDSDFQHPPELIPEMVSVWRDAQADVVEAVKERRGRESLSNKIGATLFSVLVSRLSGYNLEGATDYKLMDRRVVDAWLQMGERSVFFRGMSVWLGFHRVSLRFAVPDRVGGQSGWDFSRLLQLALTAVTSFSSLPLHFVTCVGIGFSLFAVGLGLQTLLFKVRGEAVSGFTTVILLLLVIGSALLIGLGVIGEYLVRIYEEVKRRPRYIVAQRIDP